MTEGVPAQYQHSTVCSDPLRCTSLATAAPALILGDNTDKGLALSYLKLDSHSTGLKFRGWDGRVCGV